MICKLLDTSVNKCIILCSWKRVNGGVSRAQKNVYFFFSNAQRELGVVFFSSQGGYILCVFTTTIRLRWQSAVTSSMYQWLVMTDAGRANDIWIRYFVLKKSPWVL